MVIIGILLAVIGFGLGLLDFLGVLAQVLPTSLALKILGYQWAFWTVGVIGLVISILNRRPRD